MDVIAAKQVADLLTLTRAVLPFIIIGAGIARGAAALAGVGLLLLLSWITDVIDGPIARRSRVIYHSWLGNHDLEIDMAVAGSVFLFMLISGYLNLIVGIGYFLLWVFIFLKWGIQRSPGMLFQAPIYAGLIWLCLSNVLVVGLAQVGFIFGALIITWPRFPKEVVPGFLHGLAKIRDKKR